MLSDEQIEKEQTESKSECSINTPQEVLNNIISDSLATDDKHKVNLYYNLKFDNLFLSLHLLN